MSELFGYPQRLAFIKRLSSEVQDIIVIGGGVTGAGILLDATVRGMKSCLFEMQDFAQGTSSRSTKLVHGGLRYLKQLDFALVKEVGRERAIVFENGPHVTKSEPMLLPIIKDGSIGMFGGLFGMWLYDKLAGVKPSEQRRIINKVSVLAMEPSIRKDILLSGVYYYEYRTDDARLTIELIKEAVDRGATALNYFKVVGFIFQESKISGVKVKDLITEDIYEINSRITVNATGPWVDNVDDLDKTSKKNKLLLSKGVHIVVDASRLPIGQSMYFDAGKGRMVFAIPREGKVYIGTTETEYKEDIANPTITKNDRDYLLNAVNGLFSDVHLQPKDVESGWAGLRPLIKKEGKAPGEISRKDETFTYNSGLISIAGGKLTGYRKMAERIVNIVSEKLKKDFHLTFTNCQTQTIPISGGHFEGSDNYEKFKKEKIASVKLKGWSKLEIEKIVERYGSNCDKLFEIAKEIPENNTIDKCLITELEYALRYEMVVSPLDFFTRRTSLVYFDVTKFISTQNYISNYISQKYNMNNETTKKFNAETNALINSLNDLKTK